MAVRGRPFCPVIILERYVTDDDGDDDKQCDRPHVYTITIGVRLLP